MAQLLTKKQNDQIEYEDWNAFLHKIWLEKMSTSSFYDDATIPHGWRCNCCSRTIFLMEGRKH